MRFTDISFRHAQDPRSECPPRQEPGDRRGLKGHCQIEYLQGHLDHHAPDGAKQHDTAQSHGVL
jgi:hypothetical protein